MISDISTFSELCQALLSWDEKVLLTQGFWMRISDPLKIPLNLILSEPFAQWKDCHFMVLGDGIVMPATSTFVLDRLEKLGLN